MASDATFWNRIAKKYSKQSVGDEAAYQKKLAQTQTYLNSDMRLLEIGCGTGTTAITHAPLVKHIDAVDISEKMLEIAGVKASDKNIENITFKLGKVEDIEVKDEQYDLIMAHSILHLLRDKEEAMENIHKMLKPGGIFISSTACLAGVIPVLRLLLPIGNFLGLLPKVMFFTPDELTNSIQNIGFEIIDKWQPSKTQGMFVVAKKSTS